MPIFNLSMVHRTSQPAVFTAGQPLMDILFRHRFVELPGISGHIIGKQKKYESGHTYYFRKHGLCTVNFLKDGRVHVLHGPISLWNLHDGISTEELNILIAFAALTEDQQEVMRNYMTSRCRKYTDVLHQLPKFQVDWKSDFLRSLSQTNMAA